MPINSALAVALRDSVPVPFRGIDDTFTTDLAAGTIHGTPAEPGPGVRSIIDTGNRMALVAGSAVYATAIANDPRFAHEAVIMRPGRAAMLELTPQDTSLFIGFGATSSLVNAPNSFQFNVSGVISVLIAGSVAVGNYTAGVRYKACVVSRGPGNFWFIWDSVTATWRMLGHSLLFVVSGASLITAFGARGNSTLNAHAFRVLPTPWLPTPLLSDGFSNWGLSDGFGHPEGVNGWLGTGGNNVTISAIVGTWSATAGAASGVPSGGFAVAAANCGKLDIVAQINITHSAGNAGLVVRYVDANNYVYAIYDGTQCALYKRVAGVDTQVVAPVTSIYVAGAALTIVVEGTKFRVFYSANAIGAEQTIADATLQTGLQVGIYTTDAANTFDNLVVFARGTDGEYRALNQPVETYLFNDEFTTDRTAGTLHNTNAEPGPGQRMVTDLNSKMSIVGGRLTVVAGSGVFGSSGYWLNSGISRIAGRLLMTQLLPVANFAVGWDSDRLARPSEGARFIGGGVMQIYTNASLVAASAWTSQTTQIAVILRTNGSIVLVRVAGNWLLIWIGAAGATPTMYPTVAPDGDTGVFSVDYMSVPSARWLPNPLLSDGFSGANSDGVGHPEGIVTGLGAGGGGLVWSGSTWVVSGGKTKNDPTVGAELLTNGTFDADTTGWSTAGATIASVAGGQSGNALEVTTTAPFGYAYQAVTLIIGTWYTFSLYEKDITVSGYICLGTTQGGTQIGTFNMVNASAFGLRVYTFCAPATTVYIRIGSGTTTVGLIVLFDTVKLAALTLSSLFRTTNLGVADVYASVKMTVISGAKSGLVLNLDSATSPANFVVVYADFSSVRLDKCVAGVYTNLPGGSGTITYVADAQLVVVKSGNAYRVFYNNIAVGTEQAISDTGIVSNTIHGIFSTDNFNTMDDCVIYPRGSGGEYSALDQYV